MALVRGKIQIRTIYHLLSYKNVPLLKNDIYEISVLGRQFYKKNKDSPTL